MLKVCSARDHGSNYEIWNEKYAFDYGAIPKKATVEGPFKRARARRNQLEYMRKIPHSYAPKTIQKSMSDYIDKNMVLDSKEIVPPSLTNEFSNAVNFNKETVNTVINFA